jgi:hypothetical protein
MTEIPPGSTRTADAVVLAWAIAVFFFAAWLRPHLMTGLINDEAVEMLQALDVPHDHLYYFVPSYRDGRTDLIESLTPYVNRALWHVFGFGTRVVLVFHAACLAAAVWFFHLAVRRIHGPWWGVAGAVLLGGSSYVLFYDQILTRNALSPFWSAILIALAVAAIGEAGDPRRERRLLLSLAAVLVMGMATYTSFKLLLPAVYLAFALCLLVQRRSRGWAALAGSALLVVALTFVALKATHTPTQGLLQRGQYAMVRWNNAHLYRQHLWRTYVLPIWQDPRYKEFITEETNDGYARCMLPLVLAPFFVIGCIRTALRARRSPAELWILATFVTAVPLFALGGPNLKHCLALFPWIAALTIGGLRSVYEGLAARATRERMHQAVAAMAVLFLASEGFHLLHTIPSNEALAFMTQISDTTARVVADNVGDRKHVLVISILGVDTLRFDLRRESLRRGAAAPSVYLFRDVLDADLARHLSEDTDAMIVLQGGKEPRFLGDDDVLRDCFSGRVERVDRFRATLYTRKATCEWKPPATIVKKPS